MSMTGKAHENTEADRNDSKVADDMWKWAKRQAIGRMHLSFAAKECWRILDGFPAGSCYPSHYFIAETMRRSDSAVRRYLRELEQHGYIRITAQFDSARPGQKKPLGQTSNSYAMLDQPDLIAWATQILQEWHAKHQKSNG